MRKLRQLNLELSDTVVKQRMFKARNDKRISLFSGGLCKVGQMKENIIAAFVLL